MLYEKFVLSVMAGWIAEKLFMLFFAYVSFCVTDKTYVADYEAYWLMGFPIINLLSTQILLIFCYGWMNCRNIFHAVLAVLCLYCCAMNTTKLSTKHTGLSVFQ